MQEPSLTKSKLRASLLLVCLDVLERLAVDSCRSAIVFGLVRSAESARIVTEMGAEALTGDALDAASVRAAIAHVRPDAVINELTSLPRHYTPAEMKAAAERDSRVRREGNVNLLAGIRASGVRRYVLQASGFWYGPGP